MQQKPHGSALSLSDHAACLPKLMHATAASTMRATKRRLPIQVRPEETAKPLGRTHILGAGTPLVDLAKRITGCAEPITRRAKSPAATNNATCPGDTDRGRERNVPQEGASARAAFTAAWAPAAAALVESVKGGGGTGESPRGARARGWAARARSESARPPSGTDGVQTTTGACKARSRHGRNRHAGG